MPPNLSSIFALETKIHFKRCLSSSSDLELLSCGWISSIELSFLYMSYFENTFSLENQCMK